ncbi:hypothetical protein [Mesorhizobium sp. 10J20-29]
MSASDDLSIGPVCSSAAPNVGVATRTTLACVGITFLGILYQMRWGTIPDTSWLITVCERVLSGDQLYVEVYETNPPFSIWLYLPPVALAGMLNVAPEILVHAWTYLAAILGFGLACLVVRRAGFPEGSALATLAPAFYALLVLFPGLAFSEREHIGMALFLPLLALLAWRARPASPPPGLGLAILVGASGSILLLVKPYYALMVLLPALFAAWRRRSLRPIFAPEMWVIGFVCTAYLVAVTSLHPEYISDFLPVLTDTYLKIRGYLALTLQYCIPFSFLMFLAWRLWPIGRVPELATVATLASIAGMFPLIYQAKGWAYHAYPAILCAIFALLCLLALPAAARRAEQWQGAMSLFMRPGIAMVLMGIIVAYAPFVTTQKPSADLVQTVRGATVNPTVAQIGTDLAVGHPLTRMVGGRWAETYVSDWLGTSALVLSAKARRDGDVDEADRYLAMVERYAAGKREEFERIRPDIVAIQKIEPVWRKLLESRFGFDRIMAEYRPIAEDDEVLIYLRNDYAPAKAVD